MNQLQRLWRTHRLDAALALALALAVLAVYGQVHGFHYISYDDADYVWENPQVLKGLTWNTCRWAFTTFTAANWHPLTWLSHMADITLFGNRPGAQHLVNIGLHLLNSLLCFFLLRQLTGSRWRSALVAALFALHPCHVESVAWISERKDVLSTCFWLLTTCAYLHQVRRPSRGRYALVMGLFALGLMAKPMLVTLPVTLILLDGWPLGRVQQLRDLGRSAVAKAPLFAMAGALAAATFLAQHLGGAVSSLHELPLRLRLGNALLSLVRYLGCALWPTRLAIFYPFPKVAAPLWQLLGAAILLAGISALALQQRRRRPWLLMGWAWYLVTLLPVIGLVQVGGQSHADRYTYVPFLGLFVIFAWASAEAAARLALPRWLLAALAALGLGGLMVVSARQVSTWRDTLSVFRHAQQVIPNNLMATLNIGYAHEMACRFPEAAEAFQEAVRISPTDPRARICLAQTLERLGRQETALAMYRSLDGPRPEQHELLCLQGQVLMVLGRNLEAIAAYRAALVLAPAPPGVGTRAREQELALAARLNLGILLMGRQEPREALGALLQAIKLCPLGADPRSQTANHYAALALLQLGHGQEAAILWRQGLALQPAQPEAWYGLGRALVLTGATPEADQAFRQALALAPHHQGAQQAMAALVQPRRP